MATPVPATLAAPTEAASGSSTAEAKARDPEPAKLTATGMEQTGLVFRTVEGIDYLDFGAQHSSDLSLTTHDGMTKFLVHSQLVALRSEWVKSRLSSSHVCFHRHLTLPVVCDKDTMRLFLMDIYAPPTTLSVILELGDTLWKLVTVSTELEAPTMTSYYQDLMCHGLAKLVTTYVQQGLWEATSALLCQTLQGAEQRKLGRLHKDALSMLQGSSQIMTSLQSKITPTQWAELTPETQLKLFRMGKGEPATGATATSCDSCGYGPNTPMYMRSRHLVGDRVLSSWTLCSNKLYKATVTAVHTKPNGSITYDLKYDDNDKRLNAPPAWVHTMVGLGLS
jgi:hypothetical protein